MKKRIAIKNFQKFPKTIHLSRGRKRSFQFSRETAQLDREKVAESVGRPANKLTAGEADRCLTD